ncbi:thioesterase II family protein [Krasilnikovia sp. M28-CT-15]|uniref:thioesterase II family protein n=1 Tax=Krasilnikovia sp. M28-CT-15 TaxID=3373540 RepID=UPI00387601E1
MTALLCDITGSTSGGMTVVAIPAAGAGTPFFQPWVPVLEPAVDLTVVRLPGRGDLWDAEPITDPEEVLSRVTAELADRGAEDLVIYGCCTGGPVAYQLAHRLLQQGVGRPVALVVNGSVTPATARREPHFYSSSTEDLRKYFDVAEPEDVDDEMWEMAEPRIRADLQVSETCDYDVSPLDLPIVSVYGTDDQMVSRAENRRWADYTSRGVTVRELPGSHFLMNDCPEAVAREILAVCDMHRSGGRAFAS